MYLDYSDITLKDKEDFMTGCRISAINGDLTLLKDFFRVVLKEKEIEMVKEKQFR